MSLVTALGRIDEIQQRIRSLSAEPAASGTTGSDAAASVLGRAAAPATTASAFADAVRDVGRHALTADGEVTGDDVVAQAKSYLGVPYVFGGEDRSGMDCSGLVQRVFADLGIEVPRVVKDQADVGVEVPSLADAQPGDLLVTKDEGHIVIYAGDGMVIHAPKPGEVVELRSNWLKDGDLGTIRRIVPAAETTAAPASFSSALVAASSDRRATASLLASTPPAGSADATAQLARTIAGAFASAAGADAPSAATAAPADSPLSLAVAQALSRAVATDSVAAQAGGNAAGQNATGLNATGLNSTVGAASGATRAASATGDVATALAALAGTTGSGSATALPDAVPDVAAPAAATRTPLAQQITTPVLSLVGKADGEHTMTLRVSPDDLGPVTVKAHIAGGTISIELTSGSAAGRDALRALLIDLRRDLAVLAPNSTVAVASPDAPRGDSSATGSGAGWSAGQSASGQSSGQSASGQDTSDRASSAHRGDRDTAALAASAPTAPVPAALASSSTGIDLFA